MRCERPQIGRSIHFRARGSVFQSKTNTGDAVAGVAVIDRRATIDEDYSSIPSSTPCASQAVPASLQAFLHCFALLRTKCEVSFENFVHVAVYWNEMRPMSCDSQTALLSPSLQVLLLGMQDASTPVAVAHAASILVQSILTSLYDSSFSFSLTSSHVTSLPALHSFSVSSVQAVFVISATVMHFSPLLSQT